VRCGLRFPNDWQVENRRLVDALRRANEKAQVRLIANCSVDELRLEHGRVIGVATSAGFVAAPIVVIAAGAWTSLIKSMPLDVEIEPVRGQMLCFKARPQIARHVIYSSRGYLVPRRDWRLLAGSTTERAGFDKCVTGEGVGSIKSMAREIVPAIADLELADSWAGFRPRAADDLPVLGPLEEVAGLFYATGHYRNGILLAPITGELIAGAILNGVVPPMLEAFTPNRLRRIHAQAQTPG
jgi:glycine oxidase